jgi:Flp pilus assembly protein TadD
MVGGVEGAVDLLLKEKLKTPGDKLVLKRLARVDVEAGTDSGT